MVVEVVVDEEEEDNNTATERCSGGSMGDKVDVELEEEGETTAKDSASSSLSTSSCPHTSPLRKLSPIVFKATSSTGDRQASTLCDSDGGSEKKSATTGDGTLRGTGMVTMGLGG